MIRIPYARHNSLLLLAVLLCVLALTLAGCGGNTSAHSATTGNIPMSQTTTHQTTTGQSTTTQQSSSNSGTMQSDDQQIQNLSHSLDNSSKDVNNADANSSSTDQMP